MDFADLMSVANNNEVDAKYNASRISYSTEFTPLKKQPKSTVQSSNIRKFLAKQKEEERRKAEEAQRKKENLLALRAQNTKSNKKAKLMTSRTKDNDFSKIRLTEEELEAKRKREREIQALELKNKRERMIARIELEEREKLLPRKRKRKNKQSEQNEECEEDAEEDSEENTNTDIDNRLQNTSSSSKINKHSKMEPKEQKKIFKRPPPPPVDFSDLLKVASQKQFEPVQIKNTQVESRPLTKKEKKALEEEEARARRRMAAESAAKNGLPYNYKPNGVSSKPKLNAPNTAIINSRSSTGSSNNSEKMKMEKSNYNFSEKKSSVTPKQTSSDVRQKSKMPPIKKFNNENSQTLQESRKQVPSSSKSQASTNPPKLKMPSSSNAKKVIPGIRLKEDPNFLQGSPKTAQNFAQKTVNDTKKSVPNIKYKDDPNFLTQQAAGLKTSNIKKETNNVKLKSNVMSKGDMPSERTQILQKAQNQSRSSDALSDEMIERIENRLREKIEKQLEEKILQKYAMRMESKLERQRPQPASRTDVNMLKKPPIRPDPSRFQTATSHKMLPPKKPISQLVKNNSSKKLPSSKPFHPNPYLLPPRRLLESQRPSKPPPKRRLESDDDDDDDDDDDMGDFIDNDPLSDNEDYSKYIREIFNYDRSQFADEDDDDIPESNFAQVYKEEVNSAKAGYIEDKQEEMKLREEMKKKAMKKKMKAQRK